MTHAPCGTVVGDDLPDGYPVAEGVGLYCPACRAAFWHTPAAEPLPPAAASALGGAAPPAVAVAAAVPLRPASPRRRVPSLWPAVGLIGLSGIAVVVVVALLAGSGGEDDPAEGATPAATAVPAGSATTTATTTASPAAGSLRTTRTLAGATVAITLADGWTLRRRGARLFARGGASERVVISAAARRGRSLEQLGRDAAGAGATLVPVRLGARPAVRVTAGGRELTVAVLGSRRWVIARDAGAGDGAAVARSIRLRRRRGG